MHVHSRGRLDSPLQAVGVLPACVLLMRPGCRPQRPRHVRQLSSPVLKDPLVAVGNDDSYDCRARARAGNRIEQELLMCSVFISGDRSLDRRHDALMWDTLVDEFCRLLEPQWSAVAVNRGINRQDSGSSVADSRQDCTAVRRTQGLLATDNFVKELNCRSRARANCAAGTELIARGCRCCLAIHASTVRPANVSLDRQDACLLPSLHRTTRSRCPCLRALCPCTSLPAGPHKGDMLNYLLPFGETPLVAGGNVAQGRAYGKAIFSLIRDSHPRFRRSRRQSGQSSCPESIIAP